MNFSGTRPLVMTDTLVVNTHNAALTHLDATAHIPVAGQVYPGVPLDDAVTAMGVQHGSADSRKTGIVTGYSSISPRRRPAGRVAAGAG